MYKFFIIVIVIIIIISTILVLHFQYRRISKRRPVSTSRPRLAASASSSARPT